MTRATGLASIAIGAILTFAVHGGPSWMNLRAVGVILILVGVVAFVTDLYRDSWRRRIVEDSIEHGSVPPEDFSDDGLIVEPVNPDDTHEVIVHDHVVPPRDVVVTPTEHVRTTEYVTRPVRDDAR